MLNKAQAKLKTEMDQNAKNHYVQVVGGFLLQYINVNSSDAVKILENDKTILKSLEAMKNEARKNQVGGCGSFTPEEGFEIVMRYFGIKAAPPENITKYDGAIKAAPAKVEVSAGNNRSQHPEPAPKPVVDFDINLEDLL